MEAGGKVILVSGGWGGGESFNDAPILIIKEKMTKTEVSLIDYSTPLKQ